jgi:hypothetical protein
MRFVTYVVVKIWVVAFWHVIPCSVLLICADEHSRHLQNIGIQPLNHTLLYCHSPSYGRPTYDQPGVMTNISVKKFEFKLL